MRITFTNYIFPISDKIRFLEPYGFSFENAKSSEEIKEIEQLLRVTVPDGKSLASMFNARVVGVDQDPFSIKLIINSIFRSLPKDNQYVQDFIRTCNEGEPFNTLARMWVLVKINEDRIQELRRTYDSQEETFKSIKSKNIYVEPFQGESYFLERLTEFAHFFSLITCPYHYWDYETFLMNRNPFKQGNNLGGILYAYCLQTCLPKEVMEGFRPLPYFNDDIGKLLEISNIQAAELASDDKELFEYLLNLLYTSTNASLSEKARLLLLVSIIELLLTYSPDYARFNVEDSISKQFQLKTSLVVYQNDRDKDINEIRENLRNIYHVRSKIAHGDFKSLKSFIQKKLSISEYNMNIEGQYIYNLNELLHMYIRAILQEYFKDKNYIKFIKKN